MPPSRALRSGKRQVRLQFQPLESSSPAKVQYSDAVQDRLAHIRYEGARSRPQSRQHNEQSLPTPQSTSPTMGDAQGAAPSSPLSSLRTSPALPPRFVDTDDLQSSDDDVIVPSASKRRRLSTQKDKMLDSSSEIGSSRPSRLPRNLRPVSSSKKPPSTPMRRSTRLTQHTPASTESNHTQGLAFTNIPSTQGGLSNIASPETSGDEDVMATIPSSRRKSRNPQPTLRDDFVVDDDLAESSASDKDTRIRKRSNARRQTKDFVVDNDEIEYITSDEGDSSKQQPSKHPKVPTKDKKGQSRSRREQVELAEDLLDLQDSEPERKTKKSRTRGGPVTTQRDKTRAHLELLKRRRAGEKVPRIIDSDDNDDNGQWRDNDGADLDAIGNEHFAIEIVSDRSIVSAEDRDQGESGEEEPFEEEDFVVDDPVDVGGRLGRPNNDIPLQFTSFASAKPRELFPHIIEWMVKNKVSPAFNREDEVYTLSFSRLDDQVKAQAGSRLISSAWNATFKYTILARPGIHVAALPGLDEDLIRTCDACNKSNHPAKYDFTLSGKAYSKATLEPIDDSDSDPDEEDQDRHRDSISCDEQGHPLASTTTHFYLGRFCAANAEMGHKLTHWKHHLNEQVLSHLEEQGVLSAESILHREELNKKKREREAEHIVDTMQETGIIAELWQAFQDDLEDARIGMEGHERKDGRSKHRIGSVHAKRSNGTVGEWVDGGRFRQLAVPLGSDFEGE